MISTATATKMISLWHLAKWSNKVLLGSLPGKNKGPPSSLAVSLTAGYAAFPSRLRRYNKTEQSDFEVSSSLRLVGIFLEDLIYTFPTTLEGILPISL